MKRKTASQFLGSDWVSATKTRNYILNDPLLDYLNLYKTSENTQTGIFTKFIMNQGILFEEGIVVLLKNKFGDSFKQIAGTSGTVQEDSRDTYKFKETVDAIKNKTPIIYQGVLHNSKKKEYGVPDLIVHRDYISKLVTDAPTDLTEEYYIIDIKFTTLYFSAKGFLLNSGSVPAFKSQIYVYLDSLNGITKSKGTTAFILARRWIQGSTGNNEQTAFNRLGVIDYATFDADYPARTKNAMKWYRKVKDLGKNWVLTPNPSVPELYPNMKNEYDYPWRPFKVSYAQEIGEITLMWQCGVKRRRIAHSNGVFHWNKATSESLGFKKKSKYYKTVNKMIAVQTSNELPVIRNNISKWKSKQLLDFYVDYETISNVTDDFISLPQVDTKSSIIFLIGCGYSDPITKEWIYNYFLAKEISISAEQQIVSDWFSYMDSVKAKFPSPKEPRLIHWSNAEASFFEAVVKRHQILKADLPWNFNPNWLDFLTVVRSEPAVIKGAFNFGLKTFGNAMQKLNLVTTVWESDCANGIDAMIIAFNAYKNSESVEESPEMKDIIHYNEIDCKMVFEIVRYFRSLI